MALLAASFNSVPKIFGKKEYDEVLLTNKSLYTNLIPLVAGPRLFAAINLAVRKPYSHYSISHSLEILSLAPRAAFAVNKFNEHPIHTTCLVHGSIEIIKALVDIYPDSINIKDSSGTYILQHVSYMCLHDYYKWFPILQIFLTAAPKASLLTFHINWTLLHYACFIRLPMEIIKCIYDAAPEAASMVDTSNRTPNMLISNNDEYNEYYAAVMEMFGK